MNPLISYAFFIQTGQSQNFPAPFNLWLQAIDFASDFDSLADNEQSYISVSLAAQGGTLSQGETGLIATMRFKSNIGAAGATIGSFNKYCLFPGTGFFITQLRQIYCISSGTGLLTSNVCLHFRQA